MTDHAGRNGIIGVFSKSDPRLAPATRRANVADNPLLCVEGRGGVYVSQETPPPPTLPRKGGREKYCKRNAVDERNAPNRTLGTRDPAQHRQHRTALRGDRVSVAPRRATGISYR